ncbi:hypothetical protein N7516_008934 [Penicillium verrucosum]|uniref:uncharacterized protein n=1 Tax=Penicillium verrucosum TaxID=60171 RepID=UPI0025456ECD|nr:uncharacterized protein N7516_008934 [Penicillium verrucosum]KAJ5927161.1 hypothetical protein N7516_008934 [Penicillium verrucosum]
METGGRPNGHDTRHLVMAATKPSESVGGACGGLRTRQDWELQLLSVEIKGSWTNSSICFLLSSSRSGLVSLVLLFVPLTLLNRGVAGVNHLPDGSAARANKRVVDFLSCIGIDILH